MKLRANLFVWQGQNGENCSSSVKKIGETNKQISYFEILFHLDALDPTKFFHFDLGGTFIWKLYTSMIYIQVHVSTWIISTIFTFKYNEVTVLETHAESLIKKLNLWILECLADALLPGYRNHFLRMNLNSHPWRSLWVNWENQSRIVHQGLCQPGRYHEVPETNTWPQLRKEPIHRVVLSHSARNIFIDFYEIQKKIMNNKEEPIRIIRENKSLDRYYQNLDFSFSKSSMSHENCSAIIMECSCKNLTRTCTPFIHLLGKENRQLIHTRTSKVSHVGEKRERKKERWRLKVWNIQEQRVDHVLWHARLSG